MLPLPVQEEKEQQSEGAVAAVASEEDAAEAAGDEDSDFKLVVVPALAQSIDTDVAIQCALLVHTVTHALLSTSHCSADAPRTIGEDSCAALCAA